MRKQHLMPLACALCSVALVGCTTHDAKFDVGAAPPPINVDALHNAEDRLIRGPEQHLTALPVPALAGLVLAADNEFVAANAPAALQVATTFAGPMLTSPRKLGAGQVVESPNGQIDHTTTLEVGLAAAALAKSTGNARYLSVVRRIAAGVLNPSFGLVRYHSNLTMQVAGQDDVALSALTADFLSQAVKLAGVRAEGQVGALLKTVAKAQVAVGRWYAYLGKTQPMSLAQWATTLVALEQLGGSEARGILGAGIPALWTAAFRADGSIKPGPLTNGQALGIAEALEALTGYGDSAYTSEVVGTAVSQVNGSGEWNVAPADAYAQAVFAEALSLASR